MNETPGLMTFDEWAKLPAEDRHRYNLLVQEIQQLQGDNAKLRAEIIALEGVAEIMDCGHERRFSTLQIGATDNKSVCTACEVERLKANLGELDRYVSQHSTVRDAMRDAMRDVEEYEDQVSILKTEKTKLRAALEKYAVEINWYDTNDGYSGGFHFALDPDKPWIIAREALKGGEG